MRTVDVKVYKNDTAVALAWRDERPVLMVSTYHSDAPKDWTSRGPDGGTIIQKPVMIQDLYSQDGFCGSRAPLESFLQLFPSEFEMVEEAVIAASGSRCYQCLYSAEYDQNVARTKSCYPPYISNEYHKQLVGNVRNEPTRERRRVSGEGHF